MGDVRSTLVERERALALREEELRRAEIRLAQARQAHRAAIRGREQESERLREARADVASRRSSMIEEIRRREDRLAVREETLELGLATVEQAIRDGISGDALAEIVRVLRESTSRGRFGEPDPPAPERLWNIDILTPLVRQHARLDPERAVEWDAYLDSLRPHADEHGFLPSTFDGLIAGVFGDAFRAALVPAA